MTGNAPDEEPLDPHGECAAEIVRLEGLLAEAEKDARRYRDVRKWSPVMFTNVWSAALKTGKPFDELVDDLRPFTESKP